VLHTKLQEKILDVMVKEKYIENYKVGKDKKNFKSITIELKYVKGKPAITHIKRISKPGLRTYIKSANIFPVLSNLGIQIITTPKGIMTNKQARKQKTGGEVLCELW